MTPVENVEFLIKKYFCKDVNIKDKTISNNSIGALARKNEFIDFTDNFEKRLERLSKNVTDEEQRKEIIEKIKNLAEKTDYKWSGPYSELVALDFFINSGFIADFKFVNKVNTVDYPNSIAARINRKTIDIDFSFSLEGEQYFTDIKSLIPTQNELLDVIINNVQEKLNIKGILIGVDEVSPILIFDLQKVIDDEKKCIEEKILEAIKNKQNRISYTTKNKVTYNFNISYDGFLSVSKVSNPYTLANFDKYKYFNYLDKLLDSEYSLLTFVINPWFNNEQKSFCNFSRTYYRSVCRRIFIEFKNDNTPLSQYQYFEYIKNKSITFSDVSTSIAGLLFIEDNSIKKLPKNSLYNGYLYLNPNYKNKTPLSRCNFYSYLDNPPISKIIEIDDFLDDNY